MATTTTLGAIIKQVVQETGCGFVIPSYTGTTTTLTLTNSYLEGPFSGAKFPIGAPIIVTSTTGLGDVSYVSKYDPTSGVITVSPAITSGSTDAVLLYPDWGLDHPDRLLEAIRRAATNRMFRWQKVPLTLVTDGDMLATDTTAWTTSDGKNAPLTKLDLTGESVIDRRALVATGNSSAGTNWTVTSSNVDVPINSIITGYQWQFLTAIAVPSGSATATLTVRDVTNSADITTYTIVGNQNSQLNTTSIKPMVMMGVFNVPTGCKQIAFRVTMSAASSTLQWYPMIAFPTTAYNFALPNRVISQDYIGNFYYATPRTGANAPYALELSDPITVNGFTHALENEADHLVVRFNFRPFRPIYYDECFGSDTLTLLSDTTTFPLDHIVKWSKFELFKYLYTREKPEFRTTAYGSVIPIPSRWKTRAIESKYEALHSNYEPKVVNVVGRVGIGGA